MPLSRIPDAGLSAEVLNAIANSTPSGAVAFFARGTAPTGWIKANGAAVSRTTYAALFAAIGTTYGVGDGSTTFNVPDLRGEFIRSWDDGRGIDVSRAMGSYQKGSVNAWNVPQTEGYYGFMAAGTDNSLSASQVILGYDPAWDSYAGSQTGHATAAVANSGTWWDDDGWGAGVTRPRNIAMLACIKF